MFEKFLKHQRDFFRFGETESKIDASTLDPLCIVVWINDAYRVLRPPPCDVEECVMLWAHKHFGEYDFIDYDALWRCFPSISRSGKERSDFFQDY